MLLCDFASYTGSCEKWSEAYSYSYSYRNWMMDRTTEDAVEPYRSIWRKGVPTLGSFRRLERGDVEDECTDEAQGTPRAVLDCDIAFCVNKLAFRISPLTVCVELLRRIAKDVGVLPYQRRMPSPESRKTKLTP